MFAASLLIALPASEGDNTCLGIMSLMWWWSQIMPDSRDLQLSSYDYVLPEDRIDRRRRWSRYHDARLYRGGPLLVAAAALSSS